MGEEGRPIPGGVSRRRRARGARKVERLRSYLLVGLKGWIEDRQGFTGEEQGTAEGWLVDGSAPVGDRRRQVGEKLHGVLVKLSRGLKGSEDVWGGDSA